MADEITPAPEPADEAAQPVEQVENLDAPEIDWKAKARQWEARAKAGNDKVAAVEAKLSKLAEALGVETTETVDPDALAADLATQRRENAVLRAGAALHLNVDALLDSRRFTDGLTDVDPTDQAAVKAYLEGFVKDNPQYAPEDRRTYNPGDGAPRTVPPNHPAATLTGTDRMAAALAHQHQNRSTTR